MRDKRRCVVSAGWTEMHFMCLSEIRPFIEEQSAAQQSMRWRAPMQIESDTKRRGGVGGRGGGSEMCNS